MPNPKEYRIKGKIYKGIELTEGEQLILIKENIERLKAFANKNAPISSLH